MPRMTIVTRDGQENEIEAAAGRSIMEIIRDDGTSELEAMCGGCCSCATCHVYIDLANRAASPMTSDEDDLLESSDHRTDLSRLSCQIIFDDALDGVRVTIAPEE